MTLNKIKYIESLNKIDEDELIYFKKIPYPQANKTRVLFLFIDALKRSVINKKALSIELNLGLRNVDYYGNALRYLGLVKRNSTCYLLTIKGRSFSNLSLNDQKKEFSKICLTIPSISDSCIKFLKNNDINEEDIKILFKKHKIPIASESTQNRRASTIKNWVYLVDEYMNT